MCPFLQLERQKNFQLFYLFLDLLDFLDVQTSPDLGSYAEPTAFSKASRPRQMAVSLRSLRVYYYKIF